MCGSSFNQLLTSSVLVPQACTPDNVDDTIVVSEALAAVHTADVPMCEDEDVVDDDVVFVNDDAVAVVVDVKMTTPDVAETKQQKV